MRCPNCSAECSQQASKCEFCGRVLRPIVESAGPVVPPPLPDYASPPPIPTEFESDNPYAASHSSTYGSPQIPAYDTPNHLALSITAAVMSFLCCCIPFGIIPVIFSTQVNSKLANGDYEGARQASNNAKLWAWISIGVALSVFVINMVSQLVLSSGALR